MRIKHLREAIASNHGQHTELFQYEAITGDILYLSVFCITFEAQVRVNIRS